MLGAVDSSVSLRPVPALPRPVWKPTVRLTDLKVNLKMLLISIVTSVFKMHLV